MAGPTTTTTPDPSIVTPTADQTTLLQNYTAAVQDYTGVEKGLETVLTDVSDVWLKLDRRMKDAGLTLDNLGAMNDQQIIQMGLISSGVIKARDAFTGLAGIDFSGLSTFKDTLQDIRDALFSGGTAASDALGAVNKLASAYLAAGGSQKTLSEAWGRGTAAVVDLASNILTHADNLMRSQSAYIQMAAATGNLSDLWNAAGDDLQNLNTIMATQTQMIGDTIEATGLSAKQVEAYFGELGQIPGALNAIVSTTGKTGDSTSMLTAAIQVATGTGRKYSDVMDDLKTAFKDYGLVGEDALKFSVRMSEVSTKLKAPLEDVKRALQGSAEAFKMFASSQAAASSTSDGLAKVLNTYGKALESTGLSATQSIRVVGDLTNQIANLSTAQKAFISQQTGGPGGLMGGFALERRLMQGDVEGVFSDFLKTLQNQFGKIVSIDEAASSQGAASQLEKQTLMLMQGPLGSLVKDQQTAIKVLQAFRNRQEGKAETITTALSPTAVSDAADKGMKFQEGSYSELTKIRSSIERMRYLADQSMGREVQTAMTARVAPGTGEATNMLKTSITEAMRTYRAAGGVQVATTAQGLAGGNVASSTGMDVAHAVRGALSTIKDVPLAFKSVFSAIKTAVSSGNTEMLAAQRKDLEDRKFAANEMVKATKEGTEQHRRAVAESVESGRILEAIAPYKTETQAPTTASTVAPATAGTTSFPLPPGQQVGAAAQAAATRPAGGTAVAPDATGAAPAMVAARETTVHLVGKFSIDCPHCGRPHNISEQALGVSPASFTIPH